MAVVVASANLTDEEFLAAFKGCTLPVSSFRHGDHLRLAWIELHSKKFADALTSIRDGIRQYAAFHGVPQLFHETITTAWVKLIATHDEPDFREFVRVNEHRLNRELLLRFWSTSALDSQEARSAWLPPDRAPLPG